MCIFIGNFDSWISYFLRNCWKYGSGDPHWNKSYFCGEFCYGSSSLANPWYIPLVFPFLIWSVLVVLSIWKARYLATGHWKNVSRVGPVSMLLAESWSAGANKGDRSAPGKCDHRLFGPYLNSCFSLRMQEWISSYLFYPNLFYHFVLHQFLGLICIYIHSKRKRKGIPSSPHSFKPRKASVVSFCSVSVIENFFDILHGSFGLKVFGCVFCSYSRSFMTAERFSYLAIFLQHNNECHLRR